MKVVPFFAETPEAALAEIHAVLGPEAVVLSVQPMPSRSRSRLWRKSQAVEVLAGVAERPPEAKVSLPEPAASPLPPRLAAARVVSAPSARLVETSPFGRNAPATVGPQPARSPLTSRTLPELAIPVTPVPSPTRSSPQNDAGGGTRAPSSLPAARWRCLRGLENMGLLPVFAERLQQQLAARALPAAGVAGPEWSVVRAALAESWRPPPALREDHPRPHVLIGPPGVGKTTLLCKWLAGSLLKEQRPAQLWRLDSANANTAEFLDLYGEMFGLTVERFWKGSDPASELMLVDLPGVERMDTQGLAALKTQLAALGAPRVHLVLNAAYDMPILFEQLQAFASFQPEDISFTHLDEEKRWAKLWNFVVGTNFCLRFLGAGQKIPGQLLPADPQQLLPSSIHP